MVAATVEVNPNLRLVESPSADINRAIELWEEANRLMVEAGRIFADIKQEANKKFNKLLESSGLEKAQVSKLIKASAVADEVPTAACNKLGLPMLLQLGQKRNEEARGAIAYSDTQLEVAQKIKELRLPPEPKQEKPVRFIGNQKGGVGKLRIEVPGCPEAVELERDWRESNLPPLQWLWQIVEPTPLKVGQELIEVPTPDILAELEVVESVGLEQEIAQAELSEYIEQQGVEATLLETGIAAQQYEDIAISCDAQSVETGNLESFVEENFGSIQTCSQEVGNQKQEFEVVEAMEVKQVIDYEKLSFIVLRAKKWEKVSEVVNRDGMVLKEVIANWSAVEKEELIQKAIAYIEKTPTAILYHELDWIGIENLKKILHKLSFKVKDVLEGLASPWYPDCTFIDVTDLGNDEDEVWTFSSEGREIKAWSREDFQVVAF